MNEEVKAYVGLKLNVFEDYFEVPEDLQPEMDLFVQDLNALGESCQSATEFENRFNAEGLVERYNSFFPRCTPKQHSVTKADIRNSAQTAGEILNANKEAFIKDELKSVTTGIKNGVKDEVFVKNRERMIENGTFDDFTRASNVIDDAGSLLGFLGKKFRGK